jgi:sugar lactone lactonase YvrE
MHPLTAADVETFAADIPGAEGIAIANDGRIFIGAEDGWIYAISPQGEVSQYVRTPGRPLGIAIDRADNLFVCDWDAHGVYKVTPDREVSLFANSAGTRQIQFPNFCTFDDQGNLYVSDTGTTRRNPEVRHADGAVFRISPAGECVLFADGLFQTNGLAMRRGEAALYAIQTIDNNVLRIEINADGTAGNTTIFAHDLNTVPDGMAFTANGDLIVVTGLSEILYRVQPNGETDIFLQDHNAEKLVSPANPAFGGSDLRDLYITNLTGGSVSRVKGIVQGQALYHQLQT